MQPARLLSALLVSAAVALPSPLLGQDATVVTGTVVDAATDAGVADAILRLAGTTVTAVSDASGQFVLRGLPVGSHTLQVRHARYGDHSVALTVSRTGERFSVAVRLAREGMSIEILGATPNPFDAAQDDEAVIPVRVTEATLVTPAAAPAIRAGMVVDRQRVLEMAGSSQNLGDLIKRAIPSLQERTFDGAAGDLLCLEFRGTQGRTLNPNRSQGTCNHPQVYLDGVPLMDPASAYRMVAFEGIDFIQAIPPAETGARFGSAPYGVIVIATSAGRTMGSAGPYPAFLASRRTTFDWDQDPEGHPFLRSLLGATLGNLAGLAAGVAVGEHCIYIEDGTRELDTTCPKLELVGTSFVAVALPAIGSALGANLGGRTSLSRGRMKHALLGAGMAILPGYAFSLTTVGSGVEETTAAGKVLLVVGTPLFTTLADRLYRRLLAN